MQVRGLANDGVIMHDGGYSSEFDAENALKCSNQLQFRVNKKFRAASLKRT